MNVAPKFSGWEPPESIAREDILARSDAILSKPSLPLRQAEDIFRINALGLDWDMGVTPYEPADAAKIARGADGKKIGIFLLHGGSGDFKSMEPMAKLFAEKFGCKAVAMTFPGRLYLDDAKRDWPDDTIHSDGTVRVPIWLKGERITPDQLCCSSWMKPNGEFSTAIMPATLGTRCAIKNTIGPPVEWPVR